MTTIDVNILADEDSGFGMSIRNALAQKRIIEIAPTNSFPTERPKLTDNELVNRTSQSERSKRYSFEEAKLGL